MENINERNKAMFDILIKISGMIVSLLGTIVKAADLVERLRNQKSNRSDQSQVAFLSN